MKKKIKKKKNALKFNQKSCFFSFKIKSAKIKRKLVFQKSRFKKEKKKTVFLV